MGGESGPLTFGQMSTLRHLQKWPRERWPEGNLVHRHAIVDRSAGVGDVRAALRTVAAHHGAMRTTFELGDVASPVHFVHDDAPDTLVVASADEVDQVARTAPSTSFDYATDRGWRPFLTLDDRGRPAELILCMSHLVFDGWSMRHVDADLASLVGGGPFDWEHSTTSLRRTTELGRLQRADDWAERRQRAEAYWRDYFTRAPEHRLRTEGVGAEAARVTQGILALGDRRDDLSAIARRARVFPAGILLAFLGLTLLQAHDDDDDHQSLALMTSNRNIPVWRNLVTTSNQQIPVLLRRPSAAEPVLEYIAEVQRVSVSAHQNGVYDVDMADRVAAEVLSTVPKSFGPLLNFTARGDGRATAAPTPRENPVVTVSAQGIPTDVYVAVSDAGGLSVKFFAVDRAMSAETVRAVLQWISAALHMTAERESVRIGDLPNLHP
jgi:hypothetical protein